MTTLPISTTTTALTVARSFFDALTGDDIERAATLLTEDVVLHVPGSHPLAGEHVGLGGILEFMIETRALTDDGEHIELLDVLGGERFAAAYCRITAARSGREPLDNMTVHLVRIEDDHIAEIWLHNFDDVTVNEFWS